MKYILTDSVKHLKIPAVKIEKRIFSEGELYIRIKENLKNFPVTIISNITTTNILEFLFTVDAAKKAGAKIKQIIIPFMSYARQDMLYAKGESVSGAVICSILKNLKLPITVFDIHSLKLKKYLKFKNVSLLSLLLKNLPAKKWTVVSPDLGGTARAKTIVKMIKAPLITIKKKRAKNKITMQLDMDVKGRNILIVDDMISSGTTIIKASRLLKKKGAKDIYCISTHGLFVNGAKAKLANSPVKKVFVTNTLPIKGNRQIKVTDISKFLEIKK